MYPWYIADTMLDTDNALERNTENEEEREERGELGKSPLVKYLYSRDLKSKSCAHTKERKEQMQRPIGKSVLGLFRNGKEGRT